MKLIMKNTIIRTIVLILIPFLGGCTDWLDIRPESEVVLEDYWQNETQATQVLAACYRSFTEADNVRRMLVWGELRSDNLVKGNGSDSEVERILDVDINSSNAYARWGSMYRTINYCNTFLHFAPGVVELDKNFTESKLNALSAEVRTLRALAYFYLVRAFRDVPIIKEPSIDDTQDYNVPKSSESEVLDFIIQELREALVYARSSFDQIQEPKARITLNAVHALLADVYLWNGQYDLCISECNQVLADQSLELVDPESMYRDVFYTGNSSESIFEFAFDDDEIRNDAVRDFYGYIGDITGKLSLPVFLFEGDRSPFNHYEGASLESEKDIRLKDFINTYAALSYGYYYIFKYAGIQRIENDAGISTYIYSNFSPNWIVYRLPDVILMKAEALVQLNRNQVDLREALNLVNTTYLRANPELEGDSLKFENYSDKFKMEDLVLRERQRELMFEGKRWFDLMRIAKRDGSPDELLNYVMPKFTGNQALQYSKMSTMDALYFPIHKDELESNPRLVQNPFYEISGTGTPE